jgi:hydrogenase maturation protein HypF
MRVQVHVDGVVQGVGFRPFVYRIATRWRVAGWVLNRPDGVELEAEGPEPAILGFLAALEAEPPAPARIQAVTVTALADTGAAGFSIRASAAAGETRPWLPADLAMCALCARDLRTPGNRRHRYPFTNCSQCGPRYSIIASLPYDRPRTSMAGFGLCPDCLREYQDPLDRRFHAQPVACPVCGPRLAGAEPLQAAAEALRSGAILALKGLGGYQLLVDATQPAAVARLRARKGRDAKPFAVMFRSLARIRQACRVRPAEAALLAGPEAPIVLLRRRPGAALAAAVAPSNPWLGAFLPYTPLHALLLAAVDRPLVCTSGNLAQEPICFEDADAMQRLGPIADRFLVHDRPILRPVDDSVLRLDSHGPTMLRRARGFAPLALPLAVAAPVPVLALGAQQKSTLCLLARGEALVSQHLGDLHSVAGAALLERTAEDFLRLFDLNPGRLACDLHPDYASTALAQRLAQTWGLPLVRVQHHHAHVAAVCAELGLDGPVLGLAWDGIGLGGDGSLWGGEALEVAGPAWRRRAHLRPFPLPGGEAAVRDPRRCALGLLWAAFGPGALELLGDRLPAGQGRVLAAMLERGLNCPPCSSVGRLFDAVAALLGLATGPGFEGQAAMAVEFAARDGRGSYPWGLAVDAQSTLVADPAPLLQALLQDCRRGIPAPVCAQRFHRSLADLAVAMARHGGREQVVLAGGCFQNGLLVRLVLERLRRDGFRPLSPARFPPNDGAIALGQAWIAAG